MQLCLAGEPDQSGQDEEGEHDEKDDAFSEFDLGAADQVKDTQHAEYAKSGDNAVEHCDLLSIMRCLH